MSGIWVRRSVILLVAVVAGGFIALRLLDFLYARVMEHRYERWEADMAYDADGVRTDFQPMFEGEGSVGILFVPGFASPPALYTHFVAHFAERDFACHAIRLPGFGEKVEQAKQVTRQDWVEAVRAHARELREGRDSVWIVAHSLGAAATLTALADEPELADGLVLLAPLLQVSDTRSPLISPKEWFEVGEQMLEYADMTELLFPLDAHDEELRRTEKRDFFTPFSIFEELFLLLEELGPSPPVPDIPLLVVLSERDEIVAGKRVSEWFADLELTEKRLLEVEPAGHLLPLDTGWEELVREVESFIANTHHP